jgi:hypothetical protein
MHGGVERFDMSALTMGPHSGFAAGACALIKSIRHQIRIQRTPKYHLRKAKARAVVLTAFIGGSGGQLIVGLLWDVMEQQKRGHPRRDARSYGSWLLRFGGCYYTPGNWAESINLTGSCLVLSIDLDYNTPIERNIFNHRLAFFFSGPFSSSSLSSA